VIRLALAAIGVLLLGAAPAFAQQSIGVVTAIGVSQPALVGLLENPPVTGMKVKGSTITATTTARVRSNVPWTLRVALAAPVNTALEARFRVGRGREVRLSAAQPSAMVSTGATPCSRCPVTIEWTFVYTVKGKAKITPTMPKLLFEAVPTR